jgi:hypothetical protein
MLTPGTSWSPTISVGGIATITGVGPIKYQKMPTLFSVLINRYDGTITHQQFGYPVFPTLSIEWYNSTNTLIIKSLTQGVLQLQNTDVTGASPPSFTVIVQLYYYP